MHGRHLTCSTGAPVPCPGWSGCASFGCGPIVLEELASTPLSVWQWRWIVLAACRCLENGRERRQHEPEAWRRPARRAEGARVVLAGLGNSVSRVCKRGNATVVP